MMLSKASHSFGTMKSRNGKPLHYRGEMDHLPNTRIYLNIKYLEKGHYELNIINKHKLIKKIHFNKK